MSLDPTVTSVPGTASRDAPGCDHASWGPQWIKGLQISTKWSEECYENKLTDDIRSNINHYYLVSHVEASFESLSQRCGKRRPFAVTKQDICIQ